MAVINFIPKSAVNEKQIKIAEYIAAQEIQDFKDNINILKDDSSLSYMFSKYDFDQLAEVVLDSVKKEFYQDGKLTPEAVEEINKLYAERLDLDAFYDEYLKS